MHLLSQELDWAYKKHNKLHGVHVVDLINVYRDNEDKMEQR